MLKQYRFSLQVYSGAKGYAKKVESVNKIKEQQAKRFNVVYYLLTIHYTGNAETSYYLRKLTCAENG